MADLIAVRDGGIRPLTVDALERWLRSDDVERDGAMSAQQWAQLWFVMETIALWEHDDASDAEAKPTEEDARAASEDAASNAAAAKLAQDAAGDDDDAEGTAKRPSRAERRMADEISAILEAHAASTNGSDGDGLELGPDELAAPLVRFVLARGAAGVISGAHVGASGATAVDALEWVRREKAAAVERICGVHHASFTRAMRELDGVRDGMRRLGAAARAQDDAVARSGGALLRSMDEFERAASEERSTVDAIDAVRACADAVRCAASCDEAMARGDLLRAVRRCDEIETTHVPNVSKHRGASSLADFLRIGARRSRVKAERLAQRAARDWLVAARDVAAAFGAAAIAREADGGGGGGGGGGAGADPDVYGEMNSKGGDRRRRAAAAADATRRKDPRALLEALDGSIDAVRREASSSSSSSSSRLWGATAALGGTAELGAAHRRPARVSSGSANGERAAARRIDFAQEVMSLDATPIEHAPREPVDGVDGDFSGGGVSNDGSTGANFPVWNFPDLASYVDPDAPHAVLSLKPLLRLWNVFKATGNGDAFAAQMRRERASQLAADLDLGASARRKNAIAPDDFLRDAVNSKLAKLVGFFVVNERVARATGGRLASRRQNRAMCARACDDLGSHLAETLSVADDAAVARATHDAVVAAAAALRARGYGAHGDDDDDDDEGNAAGDKSNHLEGLEVAARVAAASRYVDLLARHTVDEALDACALERLCPAPDGKCSRAAKDLEAFAHDFATQIGSFYANSHGSYGTDAASAKCRECVETLAREFAPRVRRRPGFKESHAMQLVRDSEYLNGVAASLEARAVRVALGESPRSGSPDRRREFHRPTSHPGSRQSNQRWAPFDASERDAMGALVQIVTDRVNELLDTHLETQTDWAPDAPNQRESDAIAGIIVYLDGILRASSVVVPKRNARELAAHIFEHVAARTVAALRDQPGAPSGVKKFTAFAVRNLDLDVSALEAFADSMTVELAKDDYTHQAAALGGGLGSGGGGGGGGGGGNANGGNPLRSLGRLRGAMREPRAFCDLMTTDFEAASSSSSTSTNEPGLSSSAHTFVGAAAACMRERWDDVAELERMARTVDKYRELAATQKVMLQLKGAEKVLGFRPLGKKSAEGIARALRARASELKVALSRGVASGASAAGGSGGE